MKQMFTFPDASISFSPAVKQIGDPFLLLVVRGSLFFFPTYTVHVGV